MPIYEYHCKSCDKVMEILQSSGDTGKQECPECGGAMQRIMSAHGVQMGKTSSAPPPCSGGSCSTGTCPYN